MAIIAFCGQKGGAGKSTLAVATAAECHRRKMRVILVDADPQATSSTWASVACARTDYKPPLVIALRDGDHLFEQVPQLAPNYDIVIIDCPGRIDSTQRSALAVSDIALIPVTPDTADVWALATTLATVKQAQQFRPSLQSILLLNRLRAGTTEAANARRLLENAGIPIMQATLGLRAAFGRYLNEGLGMVEYDGSRGKAAGELRHVVDELLAALNLGLPKTKTKSKTK